MFLTDNSRSWCIRFRMSSSLTVNNIIIMVTMLWPLLSVCQGASPTSHKKDKSFPRLDHPSAISLCAHDFNGLEGTNIKGFSLEQAFVVTTPGLTHRSTTDSVLNKAGSSPHCHFHQYSRNHQLDKVRSFSKTLKMKYKLFDKKPKPGSAFKMFNHFPQSKRCQNNMLTPKGVVQGIQLGEYLAKSYFDKLKSFSILPKEWLEVAHTFFNELLFQSVHAVMYGLLDEKQFVFADIKKLSNNPKNSHSDPQEHLHYFVDKSFQAEHHLFKDGAAPTSDRARIDSEIGQGLSAKDVLATLSLQHCDKAFERSVKLPHDLIDSILSLSTKHNAYLLKSSIFRNYSNSVTLPFRKFIESSILSQHKSDNRDFKLVSVDELFMLSLLAAFELEHTEHIPPVSRLVIERFAMNSPPKHKSDKTFTAASPAVASSMSWASNQEVNNSERTQDISEENSSPVYPEQVYFRVLYNGRVITSSLWNCHSDPLVSLGLCSLPTFVLGLVSEQKVRSYSFR